MPLVRFCAGAISDGRPYRDQVKNQMHSPARPLGDNRFWFAGFEQLDELTGWQWVAEIVALGFFTFLGLKKSQFFLCFYAFGDHAQTETPTHADDRSDESSVFILPICSSAFSRRPISFVIPRVT